MSTTQPTVRIGIYGSDPSNAAQVNRHPGLWAIGYAGSLSHADAVPVELCGPKFDRSWADILEEIDGVVFAGFAEPELRRPAVEDELCRYCRDRKLPLLAIDHGLLALNGAFGGTLYEDLPRELPEALQHRHPPEEGLRHAINVIPDTLLARTYGEGEIIVNSEHRAAIQRLARGFRVCGQALDGVIEAIEWESSDWFCMGVQWQPASPTSSGLDIQVFRTLVDIAAKRPLPQMKPSQKSRRRMAAA